MIQTDTFLRIGKSHQVCEDYIISGDLPTKYIILADGCSSSKDTEMGARILCHLAKQFLLYRKDNYKFPQLDYDEMGLWIIHNAELSAMQLGLSRSCLNATLIIAYEFNNDYYVYMYGDGVVILQDERGAIKYIKIEYSKNAPFYLSYRINPENMDEFHKLGQDLIFESNVTGDITPYQNKYAYDFKTQWMFPCKWHPTMLICSDGIVSFQKDTEIQNIMPVSKDFLAYKSTKGEFLRRRLKRALKIYEENGIHHIDDLSVGAFRYEDK
jgi:serine/threonine protein phosphatase PrpC